MSSIFAGPAPLTTADRMRVVDQIVDDTFTQHGRAIEAAALYGSLAHGSDGPYSDIEMWFVLNRPGMSGRYEWVHGAGKAEVNFYGPDVIRARAVQLTERWSLRQGSLYHIQPIYGDLAFFDELKRLVMSPPKQAFDDEIAWLIVGEIYENVGKMRNARERRYEYAIPPLAYAVAQHGALMLGMAHRHLYTTGAKMLEESLALASRPHGYDELCQMVMGGRLHETIAVAATVDRFWQGLGPWTEAQEIDLTAWQQWPFADIDATAYGPDPV
jgi:kanamycin nucleotidyltransferase